MKPRCGIGYGDGMFHTMESGKGLLKGWHDRALRQIVRPQHPHDGVHVGVGHFLAAVRDEHGDY